jgi:hypothetical protein
VELNGRRRVPPPALDPADRAALLSLLPGLRDDMVTKGEGERPAYAARTASLCSGVGRGQLAGAAAQGSSIVVRQICNQTRRRQRGPRPCAAGGISDRIGVLQAAIVCGTGGGGGSAPWRTAFSLSSCRVWPHICPPILNCSSCFGLIFALQY